MCNLSVCSRCDALVCARRSSVTKSSVFISFSLFKTSLCLVIARCSVCRVIAQRASYTVWSVVSGNIASVFEIGEPRVCGVKVE